MIPFNVPHSTGDELTNIKEAMDSMSLCGNGKILCRQWLQSRLSTRLALLTSSCTLALDMAAIMLDLKLGD